MRDEQLAILGSINIRKILLGIVILRNVFQDITNTGNRFTSLDIGTTHKVTPAIFYDSRRERTTEQNSMKVHAVSRGKATLCRSLTIRKLYNK